MFDKIRYVDTDIVDIIKKIEKLKQWMINNGIKEDIYKEFKQYLSQHYPSIDATILNSEQLE
jgi:wyosine [tRNA(Phe)-imidazoG37] synthetase (radical SAM superfamily)